VEPPIEHDPSQDSAIEPEIMDNIERKFRLHDRAVQIKNNSEKISARFDDLMDGLIGQFIPSVRRVVNE
jgi:hypothetical protein